MAIDIDTSMTLREYQATYPGRQYQRLGTIRREILHPRGVSLECWYDPVADLVHVAAFSSGGSIDEG